MSSFTKLLLMEEPCAGSRGIHEGKSSVGIGLYLHGTLGKLCYGDFLIGPKKERTILEKTLLSKIKLHFKN